TFLTKMATKVTVIHRRDALRASKVMQERAMANPKIAWAWNQEVIEILGEKQSGVRGVRTRDTRTGEIRQLPMGGLFIAIGHEPNTSLFKGQLAMDEVGYIKITPGTTRTSVPGVFASGDAADPVYRQAVSAAGTGCMAAIDADSAFSSTPVRSTACTRASLRTRPARSLQASSTWAPASTMGWQRGRRSGVPFAAMIPASRAAARASPFSSLPSLRSLSVS